LTINGTSSEDVTLNANDLADNTSATETVTVGAIGTTVTNGTNTVSISGRDLIELNGDISTVGYGARGFDGGFQTYSGYLTLGTDVIMTGTIGQIYGALDLKGYDLTFRFNEYPVVPPFKNLTDMTNTIRQFNPAVETIAHLDSAGLLLDYYLTEYNQYQQQSESTDVLFGNGNVFRFGDDITCVSEACDETISDLGFTVAPVSTTTLSPSFGELSRIEGPSVMPIF
jgi:hypothetical protein